MQLSLRQAAREVGVSKSTLSRAVAAGKISATRHDDGRITVEPSELFRVFEPHRERVPAGIDPHCSSGAAMGHDAPAPIPVVLELQARVRHLEEQLAEARQDRDEWRSAAKAAITRPLQIAPPDATAGARAWRRWWP
jgi:helix-turn-helix, Psq domain